MDFNKLKKDFPIFRIKVNGKPFTYLDSAATSQKPESVISAVSDYYRKYNANIHRGIYKIAIEATEAYYKSKEKISSFIGSESPDQIIYVKNATEAINLVALSWGNANIKRGDRILATQMEHHSNIVPWQLLAKRKGARLEYIKINPKTGLLDSNSMEEALERKPKIVAITSASNVLGTINNITEISRKAHRQGAVVMVDAAQSVPHMETNISKMGCDFLAFSGHKMLAPMGIGVLYAKRGLLEEMEPIIGGGDMIRTVGFDTSTWNELPWKFEAGTPDVGGAIGFGAAIDYLNGVGMSNIRNHEKRLTKYAMGMLNGIKGLKIYGPSEKEAEKRSGVISFSMEGIHPHDISTLLDREGVAIRAGHHCAMPLVRDVLKEPALARMSFYIYNNKEDVDIAVSALEKARNVFYKR
jgi:cysteine desulfurase/selenocysteine lyase